PRAGVPRPGRARRRRRRPRHGPRDRDVPRRRRGGRTAAGDPPAPRAAGDGGGGRGRAGRPPHLPAGRPGRPGGGCGRGSVVVRGTPAPDGGGPGRRGGHPGAGGAADEIDAVRRELTEEAEPAAEKARTALMRACAPFGVDDPGMAVGMVRHQVELAVTARLQRELEQAEADEAAQRDELDVMLVQLGFTTGDLASRVAELEDAQGQARRRDQARGTARGRDEVEAELARLEARVRAGRRPEWGTSVVPSDTEEPDVADLVRRRGVTARAYETAAHLLPDVDLLAD